MAAQQQGLRTRHQPVIDSVNVDVDVRQAGVLDQGRGTSRIQRVALDLGDAIAEIDLNPVLVRPRGLGAVALDALVVAR